VAGKADAHVVTLHLQRHIYSIFVGDLDMQQEFFAISCDASVPPDMLSDL